MVPVIRQGDIDLDQVILELPVSCDIASKLSPVSGVQAALDRATMG